MAHSGLQGHPSLARAAKNRTAVRFLERPAGRWKPLWRLRVARFGRHVFDAYLRPTRDLAVIWQRGPFDGHRTAEWCRTRKIPYVLVCGTAWEVDWPPDHRLGSLRAMFEAAVETFVPSRATAERIEEMLGSSPPRSRLIPLWHAAPDRPPLPWPTEDGTWRLAYAGDASPVETGLDLLFDVLGTDRWKNRPAVCSLYCSGPLLDWVRLTTSLIDGERFRLLPLPTASPEQIWRDTHAGVFPLRRGRVSQELLDALQCGRPVVTTCCGDLPEVVRPELNGYVAASAHRTCLAEALEAAWDARPDACRLGLAGSADLASRRSQADAVRFLVARIEAALQTP